MQILWFFLIQRGLTPFLILNKFGYKELFFLPSNCVVGLAYSIFHLWGIDKVEGTISEQRYQHTKNCGFGFTEGGSLN